MYKAITARVFGERKGEIVPLPNVEFSEIKAGTWIDLDVEPSYTLPKQLDTILPQDIYLVYQETGNAADFFDPAQHGLLMTLRGFQVRIKPGPLVLLRNLKTGEVTPRLRFQFRFAALEQHIGGQDIEIKI